MALGKLRARYFATMIFSVKSFLVFKSVLSYLALIDEEQNKRSETETEEWFDSGVNPFSETGKQNREAILRGARYSAFPFFYVSFYCFYQKKKKLQRKKEKKKRRRFKRQTVSQERQKVIRKGDALEITN